MSSNLTPPDRKVRVTLAELAKKQNTAARQLTFGLTLACPLQCAHCGVNAGPEKRSTTMPLEAARRYAEQMQELARHGVQAVSFTGGEPFLAREQLHILSTAAAEAGMRCGVVTSAYWAKRERDVQTTAEAFPGIMFWDISLDSYHKEYVSPEVVRATYRILRDLGRWVDIRFTYHDPMTTEDSKLLEFLYAFADKDHISSQKIRKLGRARDLAQYGQKDNPWNKPCVTQGLQIRYDGTLAPCCVSLVEERNHPFQFGDPSRVSLLQIYEEFMSFPLLQLVRVIGFVEVLKWVDEAGLGDQLNMPLPDDICDLCPMLFTNPTISEYLACRASKPENRLRIAVLASRLLGENIMLQRTVHDLQQSKNELVGFDLAEELLGTQKSSPGSTNS
jgi:pyruvate-formate lyase-activating enzyme